MALRPIRRVSRCVPPGGQESEVDLGELDLGFGRGGGDPLIEREGELGPPSHAVAVDQRDGRERQPGDPAVKLVAEVDRLSHLLLRGIGQGGKLLEVGPGDELTGLAAPEQESAQVGPVRKLADPFRQLGEHGLRQRVDLLLGQVERQQGDGPVELFELECVGHDDPRQWCS